MAILSYSGWTVGEKFVLANSGGYGNSLGWGAQTDEFNLSGLQNGSYKQFAKVDLGVDLPPLVDVVLCAEMDATPSDGQAIYAYFDMSDNAVPATANVANLSGADADYTGWSSNPDSAIKATATHMSKPATVNVSPTVQVMRFGVFQPTNQYLVGAIKNDTGAAFVISPANHALILVSLFPSSRDTL